MSSSTPHATIKASTPPRIFSRFVAIGDSTTEGLEDPYPDGRGYRGWADRLAEIASEHNPNLLYANLAVRGKKAWQVREQQLPAALALEPDLASVAVGLNDIFRRHCDLDAVIDHLDATIGALSGAGAKVITFTYPDSTAVNPLAKPALPRVLQFNQRLREIARRHGAFVLDMERDGVVDLRLWHIDRLHGNSEGHHRMALAMAYGLGLIDGPEWWKQPLPPVPPPSRLRAVIGHGAWLVRHLGPWLLRRLRGVSSGDGRTAKRPTLTPVKTRA